MKTIGDVLPYVRLKFNIDNIDLEDCYTEGFEFARNNRDESENPFLPDTREAEHWSLGWWDGFYAQQPALKAREPAVNESHFSQETDPLIYRILKISGALFASAIIGYQIFDLVA